MQTNCNELVVLQQCGDNYVHNTRPAGEEVTGTGKNSKKLREGKGKSMCSLRENL